jgi:crotonobetainyl-CoA:carnitine CoA-transferase CaiB-like acyl-CoA transferase
MGFGVPAVSDMVVVDASAGLAGAYTAKLLGQAGATVTIVEPVDGHPMRRWRWGPTLAPGETGALFAHLHHGHRSVLAGEVADGLLATADVVITDRASPLADAQDLAASRKDLLVVSVSPFGLTGPYAELPANEFIAQAVGGAGAARSTSELPPVQMGGRVTEWCAGAYGAAMAMCLWPRLVAHGVGDLVDVSLAEVANLAGTTYADLIMSMLNRPPLPPEKVARSQELPSIERTADGWVGFNTNTRPQFEAFCLLIERPELIDDWWQAAARGARADEWNAMVRAWTSQHPTAEIVRRAAELRIPVAPVGNGPLLVDHEHVVARSIYQQDPTGSFRMPRRAWLVNGEPSPPPVPCPGVGEHTAASDAERDARPATTGEASALPLDGLRVVDLTTWWAGPSGTGVLAALGADVIHVESPRNFDGARGVGGVVHQGDQWWEYSPFFLSANANKRDLTLHLADPRGRSLLLELVKTADLVVENFTPRVLEGFDLDWDVVHATNPKAVMVRMPAFGLDGPWRDRPGFAQTMEQFTGLAWVTGHIDDQPRIQRGPCDPNGGLHAVIAAMAGLAERDATGVGVLVEAPMVDAALSIAAEVVIEWTAYGNEVGREGNRSPAAAPQGVYPCDGVEQWLAVSADTDAQWEALAPLLGVAGDTRFATLESRRTHHDALDTLLGDWAASRTLDAAVDELRAVGVAAAALTDPRRAFEEPQFVARGYHDAMDHPVAGTHPVPVLPLRLASLDPGDGTTAWVRSAAPTLGQHNVELLAELGMGPDDIASLEADGVIGTRPPS